ncbi:MDR/zinc-dependent alcohol dehydrogenase-like family protein [Negadavirga shengliensis]|uniref:Zinc-binding dehydrogenase n=1 Tax=Negadavirga shengliensis TaxID=1389218 RepID=A0ABV9T6F5_9BACT
MNQLKTSTGKTEGLTKDPALMESAVIKSPGNIHLEKYVIPPPLENQLILQMEGCGICASSLPVWQGREWFSYPLNPGEPGHEGWGTVVEAGKKITHFRPGDRVATLSTRALSTHVLTDAENVIKLPPFLLGKHFPGEPLGCTMNVFKRSRIKKGDTVAVVGAGFLGLMLIQLAKAQGAGVIAVSRRRFSLDMATAYGADGVILMDDQTAIIDQVNMMTEKRLCDCVIEVTGKEWPLNLAIELTKTRGRLIVAGFHQDGMRRINMQLLNWRGIDMINAHEREQHVYIQGINEAIQAISENRLNPFPLFTHSYDRYHLTEAFHDLEGRPDGFVKGIVTF